MKFINREPGWRGRPNVEVREGDEKIKGETARFAARALACAGLDWRKPVYDPKLDRNAILKLEQYLARKLKSPLDLALKEELVSAQIHLSRLRERENLADQFFPDGLSTVNIKQGARGNCYLLAPLIQLHRKPELLWALLPEIFEKTGKDSCKIKFPSAKDAYGQNYPHVKELTDVKAQVEKWKKENGTEGQLGDIALESRYASIVAEGKFGAGCVTGKVGEDGKPADYGGDVYLAFSSLIPKDWLEPAFDLDKFGFVGVRKFEANLLDPRRMLFYAIPSKEYGSVNIDAEEIRKKHAYAIGELKNNKVRLYNPKAPQNEIWIGIDKLYNAPDRIIVPVVVNYKASPLMDHARMIEGLPSEEYQIRYIKNVLYSCRAEFRKLLMISQKADLSGACDEFLRDPTFGELFRKAGLKEFAQACANKTDYRYPVLKIPPEDPKKEPTSGMAGKFGCALVLAATAGCISLVDLNLGRIKEEIEDMKCLPSVPGKWTLKEGDDVLQNAKGDVNYRVVVGKDVENVRKYPSKCLSGQAPHGVAAHRPVSKDFVEVSDGSQTGIYGFKPEISGTEQRKLSSETKLVNTKFADFGDTEVVCFASAEEPILQGCLDDLSKWNLPLNRIPDMQKN